MVVTVTVVLVIVVELVVEVPVIVTVVVTRPAWYEKTAAVFQGGHVQPPS